MAETPTALQAGFRRPVAERQEYGRSLRKTAPRSSHGDWSPASDRPDPLALLTGQDADRIGFLVPIRHQRMSESAFTFYRGTAAIMAGDLAGTPETGLRAQICGDAHLSNFGAFASPERALLFDVNDFDETAIGPWEWDLKRLAASLVLAARSLGLSPTKARAACSAGTEGYRAAMDKFSRMGNLELWYDRIEADDVRALITRKKGAKRFEEGERKARRRTSLRSFEKLAEVVDGKPRIRSDPPLLVPLRELEGDLPEQWQERVAGAYDAYLLTLPERTQVLLQRYEMVDIALKVVGVGSVGTRCLATLLVGRDQGDPLFLQIKEAGASALEPELGPSAYENAGQRVVEGQRLMQAFSDIMLGWSSVAAAPRPGPFRAGGRDYYWRQLKDMKGSADIATMDAAMLGSYARLCGWALARAHARSADPVAIASYIGKGAVFVDAITRFGETYANQAEADYKLFDDAVESGELVSEAPASSPVQR
jgi:uncharacterized protein (DUF2252 family)